MKKTDLLDREGVCAKLGISKSTLRLWVQRGLLPSPTRFGQRVYWFPDQIDDSISLMKKRAAKNLETMRRFVARSEKSHEMMDVEAMKKGEIIDK
jgi:DNA-binding transcriptional MerR regulator